MVLPGVGWLLNMGHRIEMVHRMQHGQPPWPAWRNYPRLLRHGAVTFGGMLVWHAPGLALLSGSYALDSPTLAVLGVLISLAGTAAIPGFMTHYCVELDVWEILSPSLVLRRIRLAGWSYLHAWAIALAALVLSFVGLLALGVGFIVASVWFWQVAGFTFASLFTQRHGLVARSRSHADEPAVGSSTARDERRTSTSTSEE